MPGLTIFLDIPVETALARRYHASKVLDQIEKMISNISSGLMRRTHAHSGFLNGLSVLMQRNLLKAC